MFRIVKSSLNGKVELPDFNDWLNMGVEGIKVFIAFIVYSLPVILILISVYMTIPLKTTYLTHLLLINPFISVIFNYFESYYAFI